MKIQQQGNAVEIYGAETEECVFSIATTAVAFETLSAKLYSDRVTAIIRELSVNAHDAHVDAGRKNLPFEIDLPTALTPEFRIRDFGHGMDDVQIRELYCTYFSSSKQRTNKQIGGFGIGSKSPFSYTQGFTVTAFQHGEKRTYSAYINEHRVPAVVRLSTEPTDEKDGLEVKFPVKGNDFYEFRNKAADVFEFFEPKPTINIRDFKVSTTEYSLEGSNWKMQKINNNNTIRLIQGSIPYRLRGFEETLPQNVKHMLTMPLDIFVPIGTLSPAANRETLTNEKATIDKLKDILIKVNSEIVDCMEKKVNACTTGYERLTVLSSFNGDALRDYAHKLWDKTIGDVNLFGDKQLKSEAFPDIAVHQYTQYRATARILLGRDITRPIYLSLGGSDNNLLKSEYIIADTAHGSHQKLRRYMESGLCKSGSVIAIFVRELPKKPTDFNAAAHMANAQEFLQAVGNPPATLLSSIDIPKSERERTVKAFTPKYWAGYAQHKADCAGLWHSFPNLKTYPDTAPIYYYMRTFHGRPIEIGHETATPRHINDTVGAMLKFLNIKDFKSVISIAKDRKPPRKCTAKWIDLIPMFVDHAVAFLEQNPVTVYDNECSLTDNSSCKIQGLKGPLFDEAFKIAEQTQMPAKHYVLFNLNATLRDARLAKALQTCITHNDTRAEELAQEIRNQYPLLMRSREDLAQFYINHTNNHPRRVYVITGDNSNANTNNDAARIEDAGEHNQVGSGSDGPCDRVIQGREDILPGQDVADVETLSAGAEV